MTSCQSNDDLFALTVSVSRRHLIDRRSIFESLTSSVISIAAACVTCCSLLYVAVSLLLLLLFRGAEFSPVSCVHVVVRTKYFMVFIWDGGAGGGWRDFYQHVGVMLCDA